MLLQPWHILITPREDVREEHPLRAAELAIHLDQVRSNQGLVVYRVSEKFSCRIFLTKNLLSVASKTVRCLNGEITAISAVFNMATQFGCGKTHALTL